MLERKANVHFCCKCGKSMAYEEKSMVYLYKVHKEIDQYRARDGRTIESVKRVPKVKRAYNLCDVCAEGFSELLDIFLHELYVQELTLNDVAEKRGQSRSWADQNHGRALNIVQRIIDERERNAVHR